MFGLASSHAPAMFCPAEIWPRVYAAIPEYMHDSQPHTAKYETREVIDAQIARFEAAFAVLRAELERTQPEALIVVGDDQGDMFDVRNNPSLYVFNGDEIWGSTAPVYMEEPPEKSRVRIPVHSRLATTIIEGLIERGFDPAAGSVLRPVGNPDRGASHMIMAPAPKLMPELDIPVVPVLLNEYYPPLPSAKRCWDLGRALSDIVTESGVRAAIYASGGLSHDPVGPRAGWIDEPLDRWVLERLERNEGEKLCDLFKFDSDTLRGGTGEIRSWITVAGACRRKARVVDYIPSHHAKCGLAFAYWPLEDGGDDGA